MELQPAFGGVHQHVRIAVKSAPSLEARIGLDVERFLLSSPGQVTGQLVQCPTARAMHGVGANLVVAASPAFHSWAIDAKVGFPTLRSYREVADKASLAAPSGSRCGPQCPSTASTTARRRRSRFRRRP